MSSRADAVPRLVQQFMSQLTLQERTAFLEMDQQLVQNHIESKFRNHPAVQHILNDRESREREFASFQQQLAEANRENSRLRAEAEQLFSEMTQKIADVDPLKRQVDDFNQRKQPSELAQRCRDEISHLKSEEAKLNQDASAVGSSPLWHGTEFNSSDYVNHFVELNTRIGLLTKAESTLSSKQFH